MIIGIAGNAGVGKDTCADHLVKNHGFVKVSLADPLKRICKEVFDFSDEQLWGPSEKRNEPDKRYLRPVGYTYPTHVPGAAWVPLSGGQYTLVDLVDFEQVIAAGPWYLSAGKYASARVNGEKQATYLHHFIVKANVMMDHVNTNTLDNRRSNLREATSKQNNANTRPRKDGSSAFKGVHFAADRGKWHAQITIEGRSKHLGVFDTEGSAALAYDKAARDQYGVFARTNADSFLTPRHALQQLGTEFGRGCHDDIWIQYALRVANKLLNTSGILRSVHYGYNQKDGIYVMNVPEGPKPKGIVIPDVRFKNEVEAIRAAGGKVWKLNRPIPRLEGAAGQHQSETELDSIKLNRFHGIIENNSTFEKLYQSVDFCLGEK